MAGNATVPVVLVGRFTTFAGETEFKTLPINAAGYDKIELHVWRGRMIATGDFAFRLEESLDQQTWNSLGTLTPAAEAEDLLTTSLELPWLRGVVEVTDSATGFPVVTCYAVGILVKRKR